MVGADHSWNHIDGSTDANRMVSFSNDVTPGGNGGPQANVATISVDSTGTVTIDALPAFKGFLSADKKTIVGTSTETDAGNTYYHLMIFQISGQTFAAADLVGSWTGHQVGVGSENFWTHGPFTVVSGGGFTGSPWVDSSGKTSAISGTTSITSSGTVTVSSEILRSSSTGRCRSTRSSS